MLRTAIYLTLSRVAIPPSKMYEFLRIYAVATACISASAHLVLTYPVCAHTIQKMYE